MNRTCQQCCICSADADWICVRPPSQGHLDTLCDHHYQQLRQRNALLASRYDCVVAIAPMNLDAPFSRNDNAHSQ